MNLFKEEKQKEYEAMGFKNQRQNIKKSSYQVGKTIVRIDKKRKALAPGKRVSKSGNTYYENRKNRSDLKDNI